jgi:AraC family transcriptional regulator
MKTAVKNGANRFGPSLQPRTLQFGRFYGAVQEQHALSRFSVAFIGADSGSIIGVKHRHESAHIVCVLAGSYLTSFSHRERVAPLGSLVFVPADTTHEDHFQTLDARTLNISISNWQVDQAREYVRLPEVQSDFRNGEVSLIAHRLEAECRFWNRTSGLTAEGLCLELLGAMGKQSESNGREPPRWLLRVRELLQDRFRDSFSVSAIAKEADVHPIHLIRTFRKFFSATPGDYVRDLRLEAAASLLNSRDLSIAEVAVECGFSDQSQLSKNFKRKFGLTPGEFRRFRPRIT